MINFCGNLIHGIRLPTFLNSNLGDTATTTLKEESATPTLLALDLYSTTCISYLCSS